MAIDKVVDSTQLNSDLTSVANAIRTKGGTTGQLEFPAGFVSAVQAIPTGTTPTGTKRISITENGTTTEDVAAYASAEITVNVSGGGGISIDDIAAGTAPSGDITVNVSTIAAGAFSRKPITGISAPNCTQVLGNAFYDTEIVDVTLPNVSSIGASAFQNCSKLRRLVIGGAGNISANYWIQNCPSLIELRAPNATNFSPGGFGFQGDNSLDILDIGFSPSLYSSSLPATAPLSVIIMRKSNALVSLQSGVNSICGVAFAEGGPGGTIYIPEVLYNHLGDGSSLDYKAATNWSTLEARGTVTWAKIEGSAWE